jgi:DNA-directed RNA polymerase subunit RPC12/RpoP
MFENVLAFDKETDAGFRESNSSGATVEKLSTDAALEVTDLTTKRRLRDVECPSCSSKM